MTLFEKYQLELKMINGLVHVISHSSKSQILAQFLDFWNRSKDLKEDLLPELNLVIGGELSSNSIGADVVGQAYVKPEVTILDMSEVGYINMQLPTSDFKGLIIDWLEFLENNGR